MNMWTKERDGVYILTKEDVIQLIGQVQDPFLHKSLEETGGIVEVTIREERKHVSVKVAISKPNTAEQMQLQQELVGILKKNGASTVRLRFEQLPDEVIQKYQPAAEAEKEKKIGRAHV